MMFISNQIRHILRLNYRNSICVLQNARNVRTMIPEPSETDKKLSSNENDKVGVDFFGIDEGVKHDDRETIIKSKDRIDLNEKFIFKTKKQDKRFEEGYELPFGNIRFDDVKYRDNVEKSTSHSKTQNEQSSSELSDRGSKPFDIALMKTVVKEKYYQSEIEGVENNISETVNESSESQKVSGSDYIDEQVFGHEIHRLKSEVSTDSKSTSTESTSGSDYMDENVFGPHINQFKNADYKIQNLEPTVHDLTSSHVHPPIDMLQTSGEFFANQLETKQPSENITQKLKRVDPESARNIFDAQYFDFGPDVPDVKAEGSTDAATVTSNVSTGIQQPLFDSKRYEENLTIPPSVSDVMKPRTRRDVNTTPKRSNVKWTSTDDNEMSNQKMETRKPYDKTEAGHVKKDVGVKTTTEGLEADKTLANFAEGKSNEKPETAYDYVKAMRAQKFIENKKSSEMMGHSKEKPLATRSKQQDSKQTETTISKFKAPNYSKLIAPEVVTMLKNSILYNHGDILAINKPYGMCCHGKETKKSNILSLSSVMEELSKFAHQNNDGKLYLVHRLDRNTTGVLLLAKTQEMAKHLSDMFADHKIVKTYYALCKGIPQPEEGIIDIPICEGHIGNAYRMVLSPEIKDQRGSILKPTSSKADRAVTRYKVLQSQMSTSLLEVTPLTGYKHQIRVHLGFGLSCPIIGDHKYTYLTKLAPQKLPGDVLDALNMRQSKVRNLPMYLHAKSIVIPEIRDGANVVISAKLPPHFAKTLHKLKYRKP